MSAEVLRHRVHDDVCAEVEWVLKVRCGECVVHSYQDLLLFRQFHTCCDVGDAHERIRWRLQPDQSCLWIDKLRDVSRIADVGEMKLDAVLFEDTAKHPVRAAIEVVACNYLVAGVEELDDRVCRTHAGAEAQSKL